MKRLAALFAIAALILAASPALAYITAPTSLTISNIKVFRNLAESGDVLVMFHYSMPYASDNYSTTPASASIIFRMVDSDNVTVLQTGAPFVNPFFGSNGYGEGDGSFYFAASDNYTWDEATKISIIESPGYFSPSANTTYTLTLSDYVTVTTQETNREALKNYVLLECDILASDYSATGIILKSSSDAGIILSVYGELYYRGVVPGLQSLCPGLFFLQTVTPELITIDAYDMSLQTTLTDRLATDDLGRGFTRMGTLLNMSGAAFAGLLVFMGTIVAAILTARKGWGVEPGLGIGAVATIAVALLIGGGIFAFVMIASLCAGIGIVYLVQLKRA